MLTLNDARLVRTTSATGHKIYLRDTVAGAIVCSLRVDSYADQRAVEGAADCIAARWNACADALSLAEHGEDFTTFAAQLAAVRETLLRAIHGEG